MPISIANAARDWIMAPDVEEKFPTLRMALF